MEKNKLRSIEEKLNTISEGVAQEINELQVKMAMAMETERASAGASKQAQEEEDSEAYVKALAEQRAAGETAKMYKSKIDMVATKPLITKEEYQELKQEIIDSLDEVVAQSYKKLIPILTQLETLRNDLAENLNGGNEMLHRVQRDFLKEPKARKYITESGTEGIHIGPDDNYRSEGPMDILTYILKHSEITNLRAKGE